MYVCYGCPAESERGAYVSKSVLHNNYVRGIYCHVRTGSYGNSHIRAYQCRSVINSVSHHGNLCVFLKFPYYRFLAVRKYSGHNAVHPGFPSYYLCGFFIVSGKHYNGNAHFMQFLHGFCRIFLNCVRHGNNAAELCLFLFAACKHEHGLSL